MRVKVTKPLNGTVNITMDDHRGLTGLRETRLGVPLANVGTVTEQLVTIWKTRRTAIRDARKGLQP